MMRVSLVLLAVVATEQAWACPTCTCANPTLAAVGADQPFDRRLRLAAGVRGWAQWDGTPQFDRAVIRELRVDLLVSYSPWRWLTLQLNQPVQARQRVDVSLASENGFGPGELELGVRLVLIGARGFRPRHLLSVVAQARLPTAPTLRDHSGPLSVDAQLGPGAFMGSLGLTWSGFYADRWSSWVSVSGELSSLGRYGFQPGPALGAVAQLQYQPLAWLGARIGFDSRYEFAGNQAGSSDGRQGWLGNTITDVVFALGDRTLLSVGVRLPVVDVRSGGLKAAPNLFVTVGIDV